LRELDESILAFDIARTTALAERVPEIRGGSLRYLARSPSPRAVQDDPHNQKITPRRSRVRPNSTHLRDRAPPRVGAPPGGLAEDAGRAGLLGRFMKEWINNCRVEPCHASTPGRLLGLAWTSRSGRIAESRWGIGDLSLRRSTAGPPLPADDDHPGAIEDHAHARSHRTRTPASCNAREDPATR